MSYRPASSPDVYTVAEVVRAAAGDRLFASRLDALIAAGEIRAIGGRFLTHRDAVRAVRSLRGHARRADLARSAGASNVLFGVVTDGVPRRRAVPLVVSTALHSAAIVAILAITALGIGATVSEVEVKPVEKINLVYLNIPGAGGGGGGGGLRQKIAPPKAERQGERRVSSPVPARVPPKPKEPPLSQRIRPPKPLDPPLSQRVPQSKPVDRPPLKSEPLPPVVAPVVQAPADSRDRIGVLSNAPSNGPDSHGPGSGGGAGSGQGTGVGEGDGSGNGPGSGGGTGGGVYRPGSGIEPPRLLREVKPDYTDDARRRNLEGDVELEIVIRRDGSVGEVRLIRGLGAGLDQRAVEAVRKWKFDPAKRLGAPVDVVVEVAVEFRLR